ncbi:MAG: M17 family peptidase N-terminal domain-containing protein, partial [Actinomycetes bacterium]
MTAPDLRVARGSLSASLGRAEVVALGVRPGSSVGAPTVLSDLDPTIDLTAHLRRASATGRAGEVTEIPLVDHGRSRTLLLVGVGDSTPGELRRASAAAARRAKGARRLVVDLGQRTATQVEAVAVGAGLAAYAFAVTSTPPDPSSRPVRRIDFTADASDASDASDNAAAAAAASAAVQRAAAVIDAVHLARDLTNTEPNRKSPRWLADRAVRAGESAGLAVSVVDADSLARRGFGGLSAVGAGSARPPVLVRLEYRPTSGGRRPPKHVVLVGKGITFDSGGLSLKPPEAMVAMKTDMAGAAAVLAAMTQLPNLGCEHRVTGLLALAENLPSGSAVRPGDVVTMYDGTTVEVLNTDAEGRLVLADALGLATTAASVPDCVVDLATLTGAASIGLGRRHAALYASDEQLGAQ